MKRSDDTAVLDGLAFRRQFFLGPEHLDRFPSWKRLRIDDAHCLTVHPDLEVCQASSPTESLTLLGYALDPNEPGAGNEQILNRLLGRPDRDRPVREKTAELGGRFVLVVKEAGRITVLPDAAALRSVFYAVSRPGGATVCASQPRLLAEVLGLAPDERALEFIASRGHDDTEVYWFPGDTSLYRGVKALLPNHSLDLDAATTHRFWPDEDIPSLPREEAVAESVRLMKGLTRAAELRYPLALSMTAGWDSRLMLALSRDFAPQLYFFTLAYSDDRTGRDIAVPARLLRRLGLPHHVLDYPDRVSEPFRELHQRSTTAPSPAWCADVQALFDEYPPDRVCLTGDVAEVVKDHLAERAPSRDALGAADLVAICRIGTHPFLAEAFADWLEGARPRNMRLLDLFCWEQIVGRKQQQIRSESDVAHESFTPFNCRRLLVTMLAASEAERRPPGFPLLRSVIERLWPEVLTEPINPKEKVPLRRVVRKALRKLRIDALVPESAKALAKRLLR